MADQYVGRVDPSTVQQTLEITDLVARVVHPGNSVALSQANSVVRARTSRPPEFGQHRRPDRRGSAGPRFKQHRRSPGAHAVQIQAAPTHIHHAAGTEILGCDSRPLTRLIRLHAAAIHQDHHDQDAEHHAEGNDNEPSRHAATLTVPGPTCNYGARKARARHAERQALYVQQKRHAFRPGAMQRQDLRRPELPTRAELETRRFPNREVGGPPREMSCAGGSAATNFSTTSRRLRPGRLRATRFARPRLPRQRKPPPLGQRGLL